MAALQLLAIGDTTVDAFIRLTDARVAGGELCLPFKHKIPYESVTIVPGVGNSANAAVAAARLGLRTGLVAGIGDDTAGHEILKVLASEGVDARAITVTPGAGTNYHYVLWYRDDRTILVKHNEFLYRLPDTGAEWVYLSSLGATSADFHDEIAAWLAARPETKLAFQPGTFQIKLGVERLRALYTRAEVVAVNKEEAEAILSRPPGLPVPELLRGLGALGPRIILITDGRNGAFLKTADGTWFLPMYPDPAPPLERTGAGDACTAAFVAALALGLSPLEAFRWGPVNSMSVVQKIGAQAGLLTRPELERLLAVAPADYQPRAL